MSAQPVLEKKFEFLNLGLPLVFLGLAVHQIVQNQTLSAAYLLNFELIVKVLFLNFSHTILSLAAFLFFPELRKWNREKAIFSMRPLLFFGVCFLVLFIFNTFAQFYSSKALSILIVLGLIFGSYHNVFQNYGFMRLYNQSRQHLVQKILYFFLFLVTSSRFLLLFIEFDSSNLIFFKNFLMALGILTVVAIILHSLVMESPFSIYSFFYSFRLFLYALAPSSTYALYGFLASHGVEYFLLYLQMGKNSNLTVTRMHWLSVTVGLLALIGLPKVLLSLHSAKLLPATVLTLKAFIFSCNVTHYIMDSFLYKFSHRVTRTHILPLIKGTARN